MASPTYSLVCEDQMMWPTSIITMYRSVVLLRDNRFFQITDDIDRYSGKFFFGLAWSAVEMFLGTSDTVYRTHDCQNYEKLDFDERVKLSDCHQIYYHNRQLYIMNTGYRQIVQYDVVENKARVAFDLSPHVPKTCHINSIHVDEQKFYVCDHNHGVSSIWILDSDFNILDRIENVGLESHNVLIRNHTLYTLSSKESCLVSIDLYSRDQKKVILRADNKKLYLRGLCMNQNGFFVGGHSVEKDREKRPYTQSYLMQVSPDMQQQNEISIPIVDGLRDFKMVGSHHIKFPVACANNLHRMYV